MGFRFRKSKKAGPFRFSLTKKGIGWGIGNKYIGYSHGASGRKSLRASIPGTGISYVTPIGGKKKRKKASSVPQKKRNVKVTTEIIDHTSQYQNKIAAADALKRKKRNDKIVLGAIAGGMALFLGAGLSGALDQNTTATPQAETSQGVSREIITETQKKTTETLDLLTNTPKKETPPTPIEAEPEPEPAEPETQAPAVVETDPPETLPPETLPPETEPPITITHSDSTMTAEQVQNLTGTAVFWAPTGTKIHITTKCWSLGDVVYAGTYAEAEIAKTGGWCGSCSKGLIGYSGHNANATVSVLADCYSNSDFYNQIPASAFG